MGTNSRRTLEDFLALPDHDERRYELLDGELQENLPADDAARTKIVAALRKELNKVGATAVGARAIIPKSAQFADSSLLPNLAYYRANPPNPADRLTRPPDVVVEVLSPDQSRLEMRTRVAVYLAFGVPSVWVVDPERQSVDVYEDGERQTLHRGDKLESSWAPGFRMTIDRLLKEFDPKAVSSA